MFFYPDIHYIVEKMSRCQPAPKTNFQVKPQPNKEQELYEDIKMQEEPSHYMTINRPNCVEVKDKSQPAGQISKRWKYVVIALIAVCLVIALIVSLVAVIMYSPLVRSGDNTVSSASTASSTSTAEDNVSRISQLEGRLQAMQASHSAQIASMQSLIHTSTLVQNNLRQDLDRLRTINLYEGCIQETRTCAMSTSTTVSYRVCGTGFVTINPGVSLIHYKHMIKCTAHNHINPIQDTEYFTSSIWCDYSYPGYFTSTTYYKTGNRIRCDCEVTIPSSAGHNTFSVGINAICTLTVTKCPYTRNLLS